MPIAPLATSLALVLLTLASCAAPRSTTSSAPATPRGTACTVEGQPLAAAVDAVDEADLVASGRVAGVLNASQLVQSPPPAVGDTVVFHATAELETIFRGELETGDVVTFSLAAPLPAEGTVSWEGETWLLALESVRARVPWTSTHAPLPMSDAIRAQLGLDGDAAWPQAGAQFDPAIRIETVRGGVPEASGFVVDVKAEDGQRGSVRLTDTDAPEPELWVRQEGAEIWQRVEPCSLAGVRLFRALPMPEAVRTDNAEDYERLYRLLQRRLTL